MAQSQRRKLNKNTTPTHQHPNTTHHSHRLQLSIQHSTNSRNNQRNNHLLHLPPPQNKHPTLNNRHHRRNHNTNLRQQPNVRKHRHTSPHSNNNPPLPTRTRTQQKRRTIRHPSHNPHLPTLERLDPTNRNLDHNTLQKQTTHHNTTHHNRSHILTKNHHQLDHILHKHRTIPPIQPNIRTPTKQHHIIHNPHSTIILPSILENPTTQKNNTKLHHLGHNLHRNRTPHRTILLHQHPRTNNPRSTHTTKNNKNTTIHHPHLHTPIRNTHHPHKLATSIQLPTTTSSTMDNTKQPKQPHHQLLG